MKAGCEPFLGHLDLLNADFEDLDDITLSQGFDSLEKEYERSRAVEEIHLTLSQTANEVSRFSNLAGRVEFGIRAARAVQISVTDGNRAM